MCVRVPGCIRPPHPQNSMKQLRKQADEFVFMTTTIGPRAILVFLVIVVGLLRMCIPDKTDPMDNSINKSSEIVAHVMVRDSTNNGFRVVYATAEPVTDERVAEICTRTSVRNGFESLETIFWKRIFATSPYMFTGFRLTRISAYITFS